MNTDNWGYRRHYFGWVVLAIVVLAALVMGISAFFGYFVGRPMGYMGYPYSFPFFFPFGWLFGLFWVFIIFWALRWVFWPRRWSWGYSRRYWGYGDEYYILRQRYARGEITKEQFDQMTNDLRQHAESSGQR